MAEPKFIKDPIQFLRDTGLLFEINRQILHPFGLALAVVPGEEVDEVGVIQLIDSRDDKEGFVYAPETYINGLEKLNAFLEEFGVEKMKERKEELGFVLQEHPDPHVKKNGVTLFTYNPGHDPDDEESPDLVTFTVPYNWLEAEIRSWYDWSINEFLNNYTYDQAEPIYSEAKEMNVIIKEEFIRDVL